MSDTKGSIEKDKSKKNGINKFPNGFVILFFIILSIGILTYLIPAGEYSRIEVDGKTIIDGESFEFIEQSPVGVFDIFKAIPNGINQAVMLIVMILLIGASIRIFDGSGAIRGAVYRLSEILGKERSEYVLVAIMLFFGSLGAFPGMLEVAIPFAPLCIGIAIALGYDVLVGISIAFISIVVGWTAGPSNPWTVGIGHSLAGLPMFSGFGYRLIVFVVLMIVSIIFVLGYAKKVKKDPTKSLVYETHIKNNANNEIDVKQVNTAFTNRHKGVLVTFAGTIALILYGTFNWQWGLMEMATIYLVGGIIGGIIAGYGMNKIADELLEGSKTIFVAAMAIGLARAILVLMEQGKIIDTIIYALASLLSGLPPAVTAICMFIVQTIINFFIPSGSGQAVATLPIMLPLADIVGVSKQVAILTFQFGDGLSNLIYPTVGALIAFLAFAKVPFNKWIKFIMPYMLLIWSTAIVLTIVAVLIGF